MSLKLPQTDLMTAEDRDQCVLALYEQVLEIEQRLIPTGLHTFGKVPETSAHADMLRMVASFDRPESGARAITDLVSTGLGFPQYSRLVGASKTNEKASHERSVVDGLVAAAIDLFVDEGPGAAGAFLEREARVPFGDSSPMFTLLQGITTHLASNNELNALSRSLHGEYIEPGPGADIVQNPSVLPTGRNTHAINPYTVPSAIAYARAERVVQMLLERHRSEHGRWPRSMALVLWGLDNIKTQGEGVAQALWLMGVRPVRDSMNRATEVEVIPLETLNRPRIDVVMTVSGIFRDLFGSTIGLLDKAVRRVASLDEPAEMNYLRNNVTHQIAEDDCSFDEAATRVFSNAPGNYGTNVNFMVMDSQWENSATLGELFVTRKCFAYGRNGEGELIEGREARVAMDRALGRVEAAYQNIDTFEVGITDVDHYFEYLGGISRAVEQRRQTRPAVYLSDTLSPDGKVRSLEETVRLETRAKTLNPKWYEGMLKHGYRGVAEIENHVANTFGWSATADAVDDWVYTEVAKTFVLDEAMMERLRDLNPHSARSLVARLLEAEGRGFWQADDQTIKSLREAFAGLEDQLEGVGV